MLENNGNKNDCMSLHISYPTLVVAGSDSRRAPAAAVAADASMHIRHYTLPYLPIYLLTGTSISLKRTFLYLYFRRFLTQLCYF